MRLNEDDICCNRRPLDLLRRVNAVNLKFGKDFVVQRTLQKYREAWCAAIFGLGYERKCNKEVRIHMVPDREQWPDFVFTEGTRERNFEVSVRWGLGRKVHAEYKQDVMREGDPTPERQAAVELINQTVIEKTEKHYPPGASLLIYANIWTEDLAVDALKHTAQQIRHDFEEIWILLASVPVKICEITGKHSATWFEVMR